MNNYPDWQKDEPLGGYRRFSPKVLSVFLWMFIVSGLNLDKAIEWYQRDKASQYTCPYKTKTGSCSETFRTKGFKALVKKCNQHRIESCQ